MKNEKEIAKRLYLSGMKLVEIATELEVNISTVKAWSSLDKWTDKRLKEENLNDRISRLIDRHIETMEDGYVNRENVVMLKDLMTIRQSTRVNFVDKVNTMEELIRFAESHKKHEDAQAVAEAVKDYIDEEYQKLEE
jgi:predicted transcriptional regulator